jgi:2,4-dienoyl-CoA reductase-like NADH-dependent reductase (Old Yellow Enzyme family)
MRPTVGKHDGNLALRRTMHPAQEPYRFERADIRMKNRVVLAAMTNKQSHPNGDVAEDEIKWLEARAAGGFGMVCTAATHVEADGRGWEGAFGTDHDDRLPGLRRMAHAIKHHGALAVAQLFHGGARAPEDLTGQPPKSASNHTVPNGITARSMDEDEIFTTIRAFGEAAQRCETAGFDGIELHGAHGYLISQFLGPVSNQRSDRWGGSQSQRNAFLTAIVNEVRRQTSSRFLVGVRLSPVQASTGTQLEEALETVSACLELELDFIHVSCWDIHETATLGDRCHTYTEWFAERIDGRVPLVTTGGVWSASDAENAMTQGGDFIGVARAGIGHPDWPRYLEKGSEPPKRPPFSPDWLEQASLSPVFVDYMRRWDGFVEP